MFIVTKIYVSNLTIEIIGVFETNILAFNSLNKHLCMYYKKNTSNESYESIIINENRIEVIHRQWGYLWNNKFLVAIYQVIETEDNEI